MLSELFAELRAKVPRMTHARKSVVRCLYEGGGPMTAQEIHRRVQADNIDAATVYRNLETLCGLGIVEKVEQSSRGVRYALAGRQHTHSIVCEKCDTRFEIGSCFMSEVEKLIRERTGFSNVHHIVNFYGECPQCQTLS